MAVTPSWEIARENNTNKKNCMVFLITLSLMNILYNFIRNRVISDVFKYVYQYISASFYTKKPLRVSGAFL
jgi:hypothetical protein